MCGQTGCRRRTEKSVRDGRRIYLTILRDLAFADDATEEEALAGELVSPESRALRQLLVSAPGQEVSMDQVADRLSDEFGKEIRPRKAAAMLKQHAPDFLEKRARRKVVRDGRRIKLTILRDVAFADDATEEEGEIPF